MSFSSTVDLGIDLLRTLTCFLDGAGFEIGSRISLEKQITPQECFRQNGILTIVYCEDTSVTSRRQIELYRQNRLLTLDPPSAHQSV